MRSVIRSSINCRYSGFTLLEILTATMMFSVIVGSLYSLLYGALRMREKAYETFEDELPRAYVLSLIQKDLKTVMPSGGLFSGPLVGERIEEGGYRLDRLEMYTATGIIEDGSPWADIRKIEYRLDFPLDPALLGFPMDGRAAFENQGWDLVRASTDNLLPSEETEPKVERLLHGVRSLQFSYYDGESWQETWDATTQLDQTLKAIGVLIDFQSPEVMTGAPGASAGLPRYASAGPGIQALGQLRLPIRLVVPITVASGSLQQSSDSSSGGSQNPPGQGPPEASPGGEDESSGGGRNG